MVSATNVTGNQILEGANALDATLDGVKDSVRKRIMRGTVNRALVIVASEIRKSVPPAKTPGHTMRRIKKSVGSRPFKAKVDRYSGKAGLRVGTRQMTDENGRRIRTPRGKDAPHAHFIPLGTEDRYTKSGAFRGRVRPRGFVPQAYARAQPKAVQEMEKRFNKAVKREWEKQKKKNRSKG